MESLRSFVAFSGGEVVSETKPSRRKRAKIRQDSSVREERDAGKATGAIFIDLSKAFDTISHSVLLENLSRYGIQDNELNWFTDYLLLRSQIVQFKGV